MGICVYSYCSQHYCCTVHSLRRLSVQSTAAMKQLSVERIRVTVYMHMLECEPGERKQTCLCLHKSHLFGITYPHYTRETFICLYSAIIHNILLYM